MLELVNNHLNLAAWNIIPHSYVALVDISQLQSHVQSGLGRGEQINLLVYWVAYSSPFQYKMRTIFNRRVKAFSLQHFRLSGTMLYYRSAKDEIEEVIYRHIYIFRHLHSSTECHQLIIRKIYSFTQSNVNVRAKITLLLLSCEESTEAKWWLNRPRKCQTVTAVLWKLLVCRITTMWTLGVVWWAQYKHR